MKIQNRFKITKLQLFIAVIAMLLLFLVGSSQGCFIVGDLSGDCRVDIDDMALAASQWMGVSCEGETGLVAHWKLNESSGNAIDSSGSAYSGVVQGASWNPAGGILGGALQFDDNNKNFVWSSYQGITGSNPRACAVWIKTDQSPGDIMTWGNRGVDAGRWVVCIDETGVLRVDVGGGYIYGTTVLTDDIWHHIAVTSDGTTTDRIVLYVDGRLETTGGFISLPINTQALATTKLGVFQIPFIKLNYFNGLLDDARIYDRILTMNEIWTLAITGTTIYSCPDLNADEIVNLKDFAKLSENWEDESPPILINEFLADNESKSPLDSSEILDGNYESSDWIELHNNSQNPIDIGGWYLTDDSSLRTKWQFPVGMDQLILQPGDYLIVFASGKTQAENPTNYPYIDPVGFLHTNFQLSNNGEYLALTADDGSTPIHEYDHFELGDDEYGYPVQQEDVSYGFYYDEPRYFSEPTPGEVNGNSFTGFAQKPDLNVKGGCYVDGFDLTMTCDTLDSFICYTTDGSVPSLTNGIEYTAPIHIDSLTTLIAKSFKPGLQRSDARIETYIFIDPAVTSFNTNLPIIVVDTLGQEIVKDKINKPYVDCRVVIVDLDEVTGRAVVTGPEHFEGWGMIRRRGESTYGQGHYALEIQDENRLDKEVSLLGMPAESDWILTYDVLDYAMMKYEIASKMYRDMGHYAPRQRYVEMYLNTGGGKISTGDYVGLFMLREKIKRNKDRVDIARLDATHNLEPKVSGGYILKNDKDDTGDVELVGLETVPYRITIDGHTSIVEPGGSLPPTSAQIDWISNYMNQFHAVLWQNTSSSYYVPGVDYTDYVEETSWIDHGFVEQIGNDADAFRYSYFIYKDREGKLCSGPPWDFDRSFHNNGDEIRPYNVWRAESKIPGKWHQGLQQYLEYRMQLADRWFEHREVVLNTDLTMAYIDQTVALISEARSRPKKYYPKPFEEETNLFKEWITNRLDYLDGEIANWFAKKPPIISPTGGYVNQGSSLAISKPAGANGTTYYTLDGTDPRLEGGAISPTAQAYSDTGSQQTTDSIVTMSISSWKYLYDGSDQGTAWQELGFNDNSWGSGLSQLGFSNNGTEGDENTDIGPKVNYQYTAYFRHKFNVSNVSEITALSIDLLFDDGAVVYINDQEIDRIHMPDGTIYFDTKANIQGENSTTVFSGISLSILNEGENILAVEVHQNTDNSSDISFDLSLEATRVSGSSLIVFDKSICVRTRIKDGSSWTAQNKEVYAVGPIVENLRITELMYHPVDPNTEFIELQNVGSETINLSLVEFTKGVEFVSGNISLAAGEYGLIVENITEFTDKYGTGLNIIGQYLGKLDNGGDRVKFKDAVGTTVQSFEYKDGWYELTDGLGFSLTMVDPASTDPNLWDSKVGWRSSLYAGGTPGHRPETALAANTIVINELLAHSHAGDPDWIELYNTTGQEINISGWFLTDDDSTPDMMRKYQIPDNTVISAGAYEVFIEDESFGDPTPTGSNVSFGLSEAGETLYLYSGLNGEVTGFYQTQQKFDSSETDISFGRFEKVELSGGYDFAGMLPTQGYANNNPLLSDIVITEIYYNPSNGTDYEYVELYNRSGHEVTLMTEVTTFTSETNYSTEWLPWRLDGTGFEFLANTTLAAGQRIIVAKDPTKYTSAMGSYDGKLDNGGEEIQLQIPGDLEYGKERYWIPIDKVEYDDVAPWPSTPDGLGDSLHRIDINAYGRDYSNWQAATPTPGS